MRFATGILGLALAACHSAPTLQISDRAQCWHMLYGPAGQVWRHPRALILEPGADSGRAQALDGWASPRRLAWPPGHWSRIGDSLVVQFLGGTRNLRFDLHVADTRVTGLAVLTTDLGGAPDVTTTVGNQRTCSDLARAT